MQPPPDTPVACLKGRSTTLLASLPLCGRGDVCWVGEGAGWEGWWEWGGVAVHGDGDGR